MRLATETTPRREHYTAGREQSLSADAGADESATVGLLPIRCSGLDQSATSTKQKN